MTGTYDSIYVLPSEGAIRGSHVEKLIAHQNDGLDDVLTWGIITDSFARPLRSHQLILPNKLQINAFLRSNTSELKNMHLCMHGRSDLERQMRHVSQAQFPLFEDVHDALKIRAPWLFSFYIHIGSHVLLLHL